MRSARLILLLVLTLVVCGVSAVAAALSYREARTEAAELFDAKLAHSARVLAALVAPHVGELPQSAGEVPTIEVWQGDATGRGEALVRADGHAYETRLAFQVRDAQGRMLLRSGSGPIEALAPLRAGFADEAFERHVWRVFTLRSAEGLWVHAGEEAHIRDELAEGIARGTLMPLLLSLPVLVVVMWWVLRWAARGLRAIVAEIERRAGDQLAPLDPADVPIELDGLVRAINALFQRVAGVRERERRFTAEAAHELRTPLAALRVHVANGRAATDEASRQRIDLQVQQALSRMQRVITQMLDLARQDAPGHAGGAVKALDLAAVVRREVAELAVAGLDRGLNIDVGGETHVPFDGDEVGLGVLVRNLVDNALRYTPEGGSVAIEVRRDAMGVKLEVDDSGPGLPEPERERAFDRFHRGLGGTATGSGLGLSIVQAVVERHGGRVVLAESPLGGLRVEVRLPRRG